MVHAMSVTASNPSHASYSVMFIFTTFCMGNTHLLKGKKGKGKCTAVHGTPSHSYAVSLVIWDHTRDVSPR